MNKYRKSCQCNTMSSISVTGVTLKFNGNSTVNNIKGFMISDKPFKSVLLVLASDHKNNRQKKSINRSELILLK